MNESRGLTIKSLLIRLILIIIFIFLLIWLFPMPDLKPLNGQIFSNNVNSMKEVAKTYYTTDRLPQNVGESKKMTLEEMIDAHLILPLTDSNGKTCDTKKSYVEVKKEENEYIITVNLSCSDTKDYVIEHFGCYDICSDTCKALDAIATTSGKTTAYRTSRVATSSANRATTRRPGTTRRTTTMPTTEWTTTEPKAKIYEYQFVRNVCTDKFDSYSCPEGYTLVGDSCIKYGSKTVSVPAKENESTVSSVDTIDAKAVNTSSVESVDPTYTDSTKTTTITAGYTKTVYTAKLKTITTTVTANATNSYTVKGAVATTTTTNSSYNVVQNYDIIDADVTYPDKVTTTGWQYVSTIVSTNAGLAHDGDKEKVVAVTSWQEDACPGCSTSAAVITYYKYYKYQLITSTVSSGSPKYSCAAYPGYSLYNTTKCRKATTKTYSCPDSSYTDTGSGCTKKSTTYSCASYGSDYKLDEKAKTCTKTDTSYSCPTGTKKTSDPKYCTRTSDEYTCPPNMEKSGSGSNTTCTEYKYYCPDNTDVKTYTLNGSKCTVLTKTKTATCKSGYTLSSDSKSCVKNTSNTTYTCDGYDGYTLAGDKCTKVINTTVKTYTCDKDYTLANDGVTCITTVETEDKVIADKNYKTSCEQEFKWSTSTSVDGWSYTGNKRQINK